MRTMNFVQLSWEEPVPVLMSDAFLTVEYIIKLLERVETFDTYMETLLSFVLGTLIDEKELKNEKFPDRFERRSFSDVITTIFSR